MCRHKKQRRPLGRLVLKPVAGKRCLVGSGLGDGLDVIAGDAEVTELDVGELVQLANGALVSGILGDLLAERGHFGFPFVLDDADVCLSTRLEQ